VTQDHNQRVADFSAPVVLYVTNYLRRNHSVLLTVKHSRGTHRKAKGTVLWINRQQKETVDCKPKSHSSLWGMSVIVHRSIERKD
jgi:hypothetical protein